MIKIQNAKPIKEINELREQGLYNAPFSVQEAANGVKIETPSTKDLEEKIASLEGKIGELESKLAESESTVADYVARTESQAKTIDELNADLDALVGGIDE